MSVENLVKQALKDKAPGLLRELMASGKLNEFLTDRAGQIHEATVTLGREIAESQGYSKALNTDPMEAVGILNMATALAREQVQAEMLEFPQAGTSRSSQDATTPSETPI